MSTPSLPRRLRSGAHRRLLEGCLRARAPRVAEAPPPPESVRRVLVSAEMGIGNLVLFLPLLRALRAGFPHAHLAAALTPGAPQRALLEAQGVVDEIVPLGVGSRRAMLRSGARLARGRWDVLVVRFNGARYDVQLAAVLGGIPYRVGHVSGGRYASRVDWLFNVPVAMGEHDHEVDRYLALAGALGVPPVERAPTLVVPADTQARADEWLSSRDGTGEGEPMVAIQPGSSAHQAWKRWPVSRWRALVCRLRADGVRVLGLGSPEERALLDEILEGGDGLNAAGSGSLLHAAALLRRSRGLVSTDSAMVHVAAAVGTPVVGIYGPTDRTRTAPRGVAHALVLPPACASRERPCLDVNGHLAPTCTARACMERIDEHDVVAALAPFLHAAGGVPA